MRATIVVPAVLRFDAVGNYVVALARTLESVGFQVLVVAETTADVPIDLAAAVRLVPTLDADGRIPDRDVQRHLEASVAAFFVYPCWSPLFELAARPVAGVRVLDYLGVTPPELWHGPGRDELLRAIAALPSMAARVEHLVAHSGASRAELAERADAAPDRIRVIPLPVQAAWFDAVSRTDSIAPRATTRLLYVGRMASSKRIDVLVRALVLVRAAGVDARLVLVGDGETEAYRMHLAAALRLVEGTPDSAAIEYRGPVPDVEIPAVFSTCDVYVSASEHEGFCVPLVEAMAAGLPVVAVAATAVPETLGGAGALVEPGDSEAFADAVLCVIRDPARGRSLVEQGRRRAADFAIPRFRAALTELLSRVMPARSEPEVSLRFTEDRVRAAPLERVPLALVVSGPDGVPAGTVFRLDWLAEDGTALATEAGLVVMGRDLQPSTETIVPAEVVAPPALGGFVVEAGLGGATARVRVDVEGAAASRRPLSRIGALVSAAGFAPTYRDTSHRRGLWRYAVRLRAAITRHLVRTHVDPIARRHADVQSALVEEIRLLREELAAERAARESALRSFRARVAKLERGPDTSPPPGDAP